jgi:hypothetical protein
MKYAGMAEEWNFNQSKFESLSPYLSPVQMVPGTCVWCGARDPKKKGLEVRNMNSNFGK